MDKSEVRPLYRCCCCRYSGSRDSEPLFLAVYKNDIDGLKSLLGCGKSVNGKSVRGNTLLNYVIEHKRLEIFTYLLGFDEIDVDCVDTSGRSPILYVAATSSEPYFARELIRKGANVNHKDDRGMTALHVLAAGHAEDNLTLAQELISKGADIDARNSDGETPLFVACKGGKVDFVHLLLYFGADATITSTEGVLPFVVIPHTVGVQIQLQDILFDYVFDDTERRIKLPSLVKTMTSVDGRLFDKICKTTPEVLYDHDDLQYLFDHLIGLKSAHFRVFTAKFGHVVRDLIGNFPLHSMLAALPSNFDLLEVREILQVFLESDYVEEFIQTSKPCYSTIAHLLPLFGEEDDITKVSYIMLSHGLQVTSTDLDAVFGKYGHCIFFKMLLHMDVKMAEERNLSAAIFYDIDLNPERYAFDINILKHFNDAKLKERAINELPVGDCSKLQLPTVPLLVELSRNKAREYITRRYNITNCMQFYTVLKWLPVGHIFKKILAFEHILYWF